VTLQLQDGATNYGNVTYTFATGVIGSPVTVSYTGPAVAIPDNVPAGVNVNLVVSGFTGRVGDLNFKIDGTSCSNTIGSTTVGVDHTWVGDLAFKLTSPHGTSVMVIDRPGVPASTFGFSGNNYCQAVLDDQGSFPPIENVSTEPVMGNFSPNNALSAFNGEDPNGTWVLNVSDNAGSDTGNLRAFSLVMSNLVCANCTAAPTRAPYDFDGDGKSDVSIFRGSTGLWAAQQSSNPSGPLVQQTWGSAALGDVIVPADYNNDGKADFAVYRPSSGTWYISYNGGGSLSYNWGTSTDIPVPADYDNDGKADIAVWRPSNGNWYVVRSSDGAIQTFAWGASTDKPVAGDYNGDGKADFAVVRNNDPIAGSNTYYVSYNGGGFVSQQWGASSDVVVPGDFDGDHKTDYAVWRASTGNWYILNSGGGTTAVAFGLNGDTPVAADYDGDGRTDMAVFRSSDTNWYLLRSTAGFTGIPFGVASDTLIPAAYNR
jgi:subtilisin-like proprotein convertase family protein